MLDHGDWLEVLEFLSSKPLIDSFTEPKADYVTEYQIFTASCKGDTLKVNSYSVNDQGKSEAAYRLKDIKLFNSYSGPTVRITANSNNRYPLMMVSVTQKNIEGSVVLINLDDTDQVMIRGEDSTLWFQAFFMDSFYQFTHYFDWFDCSWSRKERDCSGLGCLVDWGVKTFNKGFNNCQYLYVHSLKSGEAPTEIAFSVRPYTGPSYKADSHQRENEFYLYHAYGLLPDGPYIVYGPTDSNFKASCHFQSYYFNNVDKRFTCDSAAYKVIMYPITNQSLQSNWHDVHSLLVYHDLSKRREKMDTGSSAMMRYTQRHVSTSAGFGIYKPKGFIQAEPPEPFMSLVYVMVFLWIVNLVSLALFFIYIKDNINKLQALNEKFNRHNRLRSLMARIIRKRKLKGRRLRKAMTNYKKSTTGTNKSSTTKKSSTTTKFSTAKASFSKKKSVKSTKSTKGGSRRF